jgi:chemotaxis protein CheD
MSKPERLSLVERMAQARDRVVEARHEPAAAPRVARQPAVPLAVAATHTHSTKVRQTPARAVGGHGTAAWQVADTPGQLVNLMPGQMYFGAHAQSVKTLLGSCVAITLWHPQRHIGGMCHFLLPSRSGAHGAARDGRYGNEAVEAMVEQLMRHGTRPQDYLAHLYGGADTMPEGTNLKFNVGERNIEQSWKLIEQHGFQLDGVDVGEDIPRTVTLTLLTGAVEMSRGKGRAPVAPDLGKLVNKALRKH